MVTLSITAEEEKKQWNFHYGFENERLYMQGSGGVEVYLAHGPNMIQEINKSYGYKSIALRVCVRTILSVFLEIFDIPLTGIAAQK